MRAVHLGPAERLLVDDLVDRHLHERRPAEIGRAAALDEHRVVAHPRRVGAAGGVRPERDGDGRDAHLRHLREVAEARPALDEQVGLAGQVGAGRLVEQDQREPVLLDDLVEALLLAPARRVGRSAAVRHVGAADRHQRVLDDADHVDDAGADRVLRSPRGERAAARAAACSGRRAARCVRARASCRGRGAGRRSAARRSSAPTRARRRPCPTAPASRRGSPGSRRISCRADCAAPSRSSSIAPLHPCTPGRQR